MVDVFVSGAKDAGSEICMLPVAKNTEINAIATVSSASWQKKLELLVGFEQSVTRDLEGAVSLFWALILTSSQDWTKRR